MKSVLLQSTALFTCLFLIGYYASHFLYKTQGKNFYKSTLWIKVMLWIPIFAMLLVYIAYPHSFGLVVITLVALGCLIESVNRLRVSSNKNLVIAYSSLVIAAVSLFAFAPNIFNDRFMPIILTVCFASVLADVFAFFFGNFFGKHHLPTALNNRKSWEGVIGELFGASIGVLLTSFIFKFNLSFMIFFLIGLGAIIGDLANSYVKRRENIKDWSQNIPGHGGYLDRFASLGGSMALVVLFYY